MTIHISRQLIVKDDGSGNSRKYVLHQLTYIFNGLEIIESTALYIIVYDHNTNEYLRIDFI